MVGMGSGGIGVGCVVLLCVGWKKLNNSYSYKLKTLIVFTFEAHDIVQVHNNSLYAQPWCPNEVSVSLSE